MPHDLLYIHPLGHLNDLAIPAGAVSCMNSVAAPKIGRYAFEVSDDEIRSASVIAMDLHWSVGIPGFDRLVRHVRKVNPRATQVVGGITAGHYASEIIERYGVDYVIRGDSEPAFSSLVESLLLGREPSAVPNTFSRSIPNPTCTRMSAEEFDSTDSLTIDWFPTFDGVANWDVAAFGQGRTLCVSRGCPLRCPPCYGSLARTFGKGYLLRSADNVVERLRLAEALGVENLRLIIGKPPRTWLSEFFATLVERGPFRFGSNVGLYLCTPPSAEDISALDSAFQNPVVISVVPPEEHVPALAPDRLDEERDAWLKAAHAASSTRWIGFDVWAVSNDQFTRLLGDFKETDPHRVKVSFAAVWHVTRAGDSEDTGIDAVHEAMRPVWTFYAARLLSPALAEMLAPFNFLDEMARDPSGMAAPEGPLSCFHEAFMINWDRHKVPTIPGLSFSIVPVELSRGFLTAPEYCGTHYHGSMGVAAAGSFVVCNGSAGKLLHVEESFDGIRLSGSFTLPDRADAIAFIPLPPGQESPDHDWLGALGEHGLTIMKTPRELLDRPGVGIQVTLRVQDITTLLLDPSGDVASRGRADLAYFQPRRHRTGGDFKDGPAAEHGTG